MKNLLTIICLLLSITVYAQSNRERLEDIEDKLDGLMLQRQYDELDKLAEHNRQLRKNLPPKEIDVLLANSPCNVALVGDRFQKFTPERQLINPKLNFIGWSAFSFSRTKSLIFIKNDVLGGSSDIEIMEFTKIVVEKHLSAIRKLCPNIPPDLFKK